MPFCIFWLNMCIFKNIKYVVDKFYTIKVLYTEVTAWPQVG